MNFKSNFASMNWILDIRECSLLELILEDLLGGSPGTEFKTSPQRKIDISLKKTSS